MKESGGGEGIILRIKVFINPFHKYINKVPLPMFSNNLFFPIFFEIHNTNAEPVSALII